MSNTYDWNRFVKDTTGSARLTEPETGTGPPGDSADQSTPDGLRQFIVGLPTDLPSSIAHVIGVFIHQQCGGSRDGLTLYDNICRQLSDYRGSDAVAADYQSFADFANKRPVEQSTIERLIADQVEPAEVSFIQPKDGEFKRCDFEVVKPQSTAPESPAKSMPFVLDKHSMTGRSSELEAEQVDRVFVLEPLARLGESTVIFAAPNTGKTLITLALVIECVNAGRVPAQNIYYLDDDDPHHGLIEKLLIFEDPGMHLLATGYHGLNASRFPQQIDEACRRNQVHGKVFIFDTIKKQVDVNRKRDVADWGRRNRQITAKGGTVISLGHVNKRLNSDGKPIFSGVTDFVDDCDTAYLVRTVNVDDRSQVATVEFENIKRRGDVASRAGFQFSIDPGISYQERLASVERLDDATLAHFQKAETEKSDAELIKVAVECIESGTDTKMRLRDAIAEQADISKRSAIRLIERYEGSDPTVHRWSYTVQARGKKVYSILNGEING